jgi:hypothetical protein
MIGFIFVIISDWIVAVFDPPYYLFNTNYKLIDIQETIFETVVHIILCIIVVYWTSKLMKKIRTLEGFMVICASCKRIQIDGRWVEVENVISDNSDLQFSHGICEECAKKLYGDRISSSLRSVDP